MTHTPDAATWLHREVIDTLRERATNYEREARRLRAIADKIEDPPEGVRVEFGDGNTLRFVGPTVEFSHA